MRFTTRHILKLLPTFVFLLPACGDDSGPSHTLEGVGQDAVGDFDIDPNVTVNPDIVRVIGRIEDDTLLLQVDFAPGVVADSTSIQFAIDIDQNSATGSINDYDHQGTEYLVDVYGYMSTVNLFRYDSNLSTYVPLGPTSISVTSATSITTRIALLALGSDDGRLDFKTAAGSRAGAYVSEQLDFAPEESAGPVHVD